MGGEAGQKYYVEHSRGVFLDCGKAFDKVLGNQFSKLELLVGSKYLNWNFQLLYDRLHTVSKFWRCLLVLKVLVARGGNS
jgi:hypothetical protein